MHICFICREYVPSLRGGGIASYTKEMAESLVRLKHKVTVICASDNTKKEYNYTENGVNIIRLSGGDFIIPQVEKKTLLNRFRLFYRFFSYRKKILETIESIKDIDIIEVPEYGAESYFLSKINIPIVIRLHASTLILNEIISGKKGMNKSNWYIYWQSLQEFKIIKRAKYITSCSLSMKNIITKKLDIAADKIKVIYNPIKTDTENNIVLNSFRNKKTVTILLPGAVYNLKGGEELIKACIELRRITNIECKLLLVGKKGAFADYLEHKYSKYNWIKIPGPIRRDELMNLYKEVDLVCLPSWWENMPMACIEAMLSGAIVLGSNSGGMSEIIDDGKNGFLVEPKNPQLLAEKIKQILSLDEEEKKIISMNAIKRIKENFSLEVILKQTLDYYNKVIEKEKKLN